ncbi:MAG: 50S ribosomal protein L5 [Betaproteobacteria bacterium]|nr:50S ribosomal protein L5 [Betaproteobacteria bacterium]
MARFEEFYRGEVVKSLMSQFGYKSVMEVPRIQKITLNMGVGEAAEIEYDKVDALRGMNITITTTAKTDEEARALLAAFRFPFKN